MCLSCGLTVNDTFSVEALPWNIIVQDHWRWRLSIDHTVGGVTMTSSDVCFGSKQLASGLQAHRSADTCLAYCHICKIQGNIGVNGVCLSLITIWEVLILSLFWDFWELHAHTTHNDGVVQAVTFGYLMYNVLVTSCCLYVCHTVKKA